MKSKRFFATVMAVVLVFTLSACSAGGSNSTETEKASDTVTITSEEDDTPMTPPFSKLPMDCTKDEMTETYGEPTTTGDAQNGGKVYSYYSSYKDTAGFITFSFDTNEELVSIYWTATPNTESDYTELANGIKSDLAEQYGDIYFTNDSGEVSVWDGGNYAVTLMQIESTSQYIVLLNYSMASADDIAKGFTNDAQNSGSSSSTSTSKGESSSSSSSSSVSVGKKNALDRALRYLESSAFSHDGLVEQLEYEGFSHTEALYGADNCGADWNEQAAKKAKQYQDSLSLSKERLIEQLKYEGFTSSQASYGARSVGY